MIKIAKPPFAFGVCLLTLAVLSLSGCIVERDRDHGWHDDRGWHDDHHDDHAYHGMSHLPPDNVATLNYRTVSATV